MAKTKTPAAHTKKADTTEDIQTDVAVQEQEVEVAEIQAPPVPVENTPAQEVAEVQSTLPPAPEVAAPVLETPIPASASSLDIIPEHYEQTFDLEEYARFRRLNAAQVGLLAYVAKSYPRTVGEWDVLKKANLGG